MNQSKFDRGDKAALVVALVMAAAWGAVIFVYLSFVALAVTRGRPLRWLGRRARAALVPGAVTDLAEEQLFEPYDPAAMLELYRQQADSRLAQGDTAAAANLFNLLGYQFTGEENLDSALACHRRAAALREVVESDPLLRAGGLVAVAGTFASFGLQDSALVEYLAVHDAYANSDDPDLASWGGWWLQSCLEELGEERFLEVCRDAGRSEEEAAELLQRARDAAWPKTGG